MRNRRGTCAGPLLELRHTRKSSKNLQFRTLRFASTRFRLAAADWLLVRVFVFRVLDDDDHLRATQGREQRGQEDDWNSLPYGESNVGHARCVHEVVGTKKTRNIRRSDGCSRASLRAAKNAWYARKYQSSASSFPI